MKTSAIFRPDYLSTIPFETLESRLLLSAQTVSTWDMFPLIDNADRIYQITKDGKKANSYNEHISISGDVISFTDKAMVPGDSADNVRWRVEHADGGLADGIYLERMWSDSFSLRLSDGLLMTPTLTTETTSRDNFYGALYVADVGSFTVNGIINRNVYNWTTVTVPSGQYEALQVEYKWFVTGSRMIYVPEIHQSVNVEIEMSIQRTDYLVENLGSVQFQETDTVFISIADGLASKDSSTTIVGKLVRTKNVSSIDPHIQVTGVSYKSGVFDNANPFTVNVSEIYRTINVNNENYQVSAVLSLDKIWGNEDDIVIQAGQSLTPQSAGKSQKLTLSAALDPALVVPGIYYVGVRFDDSTTLSTNDATSNIWWSAKADVNILNMVDLRVVNGDVKISETTGGQQADQATYRIGRLNSDDSSAMKVDFGVSGSATRGKDYVLQVGGQTITGNSVTIAAGAMYADIVVVPIDDAVVEKMEAVTLTLKPNTKVYGADALHLKESLSLYDLAVPIVSVKTTRNTAEQNVGITDKYGLMVFTRVGDDIRNEKKILVQLSGIAITGKDNLLKTADYQTITVNDDGTALITIAAWTKTAVVYVMPINDVLKEGMEKLELTILSESGAPTYRPDIKAANTHAVIAITDDDLAADSLAGTIASLAATAKDDATGAKVTINQKLYLEVNDFVSQFKNAVDHGTYSLTKIDGKAVSITANFDNHDAYSLTLTFTSATGGRLTGTGTLGGKAVTISGSFSLVIPAASYAPATLDGQKYIATVTAGSNKADLKIQTTWDFAETQLNATTSSESVAYTYTYKPTSTFGLVKRIDSGSRVSWSVLVFGKNKTYAFVTASDDQNPALWQAGVFKLSA